MRKSKDENEFLTIKSDNINFNSVSAGHIIDYIGTVQNISFTPGQGVGSQVNVSIPIINDNFVEDNKSFFGRLSLFYFFINYETTVMFNISQSVSLKPNETEITIIDDDGKFNFQTTYIEINACSWFVSVT